MPRFQILNSRFNKQVCFWRNKSWGKAVITGVIIISIAIFLRIYQLLSLPIFADEAIYIRWAQVMRAEGTLRFLPLTDGKQPLFMWATIPFLKIISDPLVSGRLLSVVSGLTSMVGIALVTQTLTKSTKSGLAAAGLYAVSPFFVFFDRMALVDSMLAAFGIWSLYFAVLTARHLRLDTAMLTGFALGGAWLTKSPGVFFFVLLPVVLLLTTFKKSKDNLFKVLKLTGLWIVSWTIGFSLYNILRLGPDFHMIGLRNKDYIFSLQEVLKHPLDPFQFHVKEEILWVWGLLPWPTAILAIIGVVILFKLDWKKASVISLWFFIPLMVQAEFAKVFTSRYILFALPPLLVFAAIAFDYFTKRMDLKKTLLISLPIFLIPIFLNLKIITNPQKANLPRDMRSGYLEEWTSGTGIRQVAEFIKKQKTQSGNTLVATEGFFGTLPDGLQIYLSDIPGIVVKGVGITIVSIDSSLTNAKKAGDTVFLVVNESRFKIPNYEAEGLKLINSYPKAQRPDGTADSLLLLELVDAH